MLSEDELERIARALAAQPDRPQALALLLGEARRLTRAEAGTVYVREGDHLRFAATQNDVLAQRLGDREVQRRLAAEPLLLTAPSIASYVALTRATVNIPDVYEIPLERPYSFDRQFDARNSYRTRSMLAMPMRDARGRVIAVLQLINALDAEGRVVPFDREHETVVEALLGWCARQGSNLRPSDSKSDALSD